MLKSVGKIKVKIESFFLNSLEVKIITQREKGIHYGTKRTKSADWTSTK